MEAGREAIILLGHGSRVPEAGRDMERIAAGLKAKYRHAVVEPGYMAHQAPLFAAALARCVALGARRIVVMPYFLHSGAHMRQDIPEILAGEARNHPEVQIVLGCNLGFDETLVDLVQKRILEAANMPVIQKSLTTQKESAVCAPSRPQA